MVPKCWKFFAKCFRCALWLCLTLMLISPFALSAHARVSPASPGDPAGKPTPSVTFGIGPGDSVFAGGGDSGWFMIGAAINLSA